LLLMQISHPGKRRKKAPSLEKGRGAGLRLIISDSRGLSGSVG